MQMHLHLFDPSPQGEPNFLPPPSLTTGTNLFDPLMYSNVQAFLCSIGVKLPPPLLKNYQSLILNQLMFERLQSYQRGRFQ